MAKKQKIVMLGSGVSAGDLSLKADKASPTFTGPVTTSGAVVSAGTAMTGEVINVALRDNLYSATADVTWTHSATPAVGQEYGVIVTTDGTARTITYPVTVFSQARGADITNSTFPANSTNKVIVRRTASGYLILGDPLTLRSALNIIGKVPLRSFSSATDVALTDVGCALLHPSTDTTARTVTIPANASVPIPVESTVTFINQASAGVVTIAITSDTMRLAGAGTTGSRTLAANGIATAVKLTATEWLISGTGLT